MEAPMFLKCFRIQPKSRHLYFIKQTFANNRFLDQTLPAAASKCYASTEAQNPNIRQIFRTAENDPRYHSPEHIGLFYTVDQNEMNTVFKGSVHAHYLRLLKTFGENSFMVRQPSLELNGYLKNVNLSHPVSRFVLYGRRGVGKTFCLNHTLQFCSRENWVLLHVPWAGKWVRGWQKEIAESSHKPNRFDLPTDAAEWLNHFRAQNQGKLGNLKTTSEYFWTKREKAEVGTPLEEIIQFGLNRLKFSSDCVGVLLKELRMQAKASGLKLLVAVDGVNAFFVEWTQQNALKISKRQRLHPSQISLVHNFKKMLTPTWSHGAVVCIVDENCNDYEFRENYTPHYLLGQKGFECLDPFVPILVPEFSEKEARSCLEYFIDQNWVQHESGKTEDGKKEILFVSNRNPYKLYKVCSSL